MEIDVTHMVEDADKMPMLSGSEFELGKNAAQFTWNNSRMYASDNPLLSTPEEIQAARDYFKGFGAWDDLNQWPAEDIQALLVQEVAGEIREMEACGSYEDYKADAEQGQVQGNLYRGDDGRWFYYVGH